MSSRRRRLAAALAALAALALSACATEAGYRALLAKWEGASEAALVAAWGVPDGFYETPDGIRFLSYRREDIDYLPGTSGTAYVDPVTGLVQTTPGQPGLLRRATCKTTFKLVDGAVRGWSYRGDDCVAR